MTFTKGHTVLCYGVPAVVKYVPGDVHPDGWTHRPDEYGLMVLCQPDGAPGAWGTTAMANDLRPIRFRTRPTKRTA